ncbi:ABC-F family ATP-binding cassette domain-containing protein [candidate division KSB1 bacterium]|nr:ABC-F family ATP-binding cassette domain-containing protein [candidate division KSB1 bacterium]
MSDFILVNNLTFGFPNSTEPIFNNLSLQLHSGWTGIVGPNGSGKSTFCKLLAGTLLPDSGHIDKPGTIYYCEQRTDDMPVDFIRFMTCQKSQTYKLKIQLSIKDDWVQRWDTLSHGERKRCQIAAAFFANPSIMAVDEPSNHLDFSSKNLLYQALRQFRGIGLLISHDRFFLDNLCQHTLFISASEVELRKNNYSTAIAARCAERNFQVHQYQIARKQVKKLTRQVNLQQAKVQASQNKKSKRNIRRKDHDASAKTDLARLTGKDAVQGRALERMHTRLSKAQQEQQDKKQSKTFDLGVKFESSEINRFFPITIVSHYLKMGDKKKLYVPNLSLGMKEKIGLAGDNGSGKSTFIHDVVQKIKIPDQFKVYIPQEIPLQSSINIIREIKTFNNEDKGRLLTLIRRLGSDPARILDTEVPSPGEVRKLLLAYGLLKNPAVIVMDEPTNHMDLPSIECIEDALKFCGCAMLLVSHDFSFLSKVCSSFWIFSFKNANDSFIRSQNSLSLPLNQ